MLQPCFQSRILVRLVCPVVCVVEFCTCDLAVKKLWKDMMSRIPQQHHIADSKRRVAIRPLALIWTKQYQVFFPKDFLGILDEWCPSTLWDVNKTTSNSSICRSWKEWRIDWHALHLPISELWRSDPPFPSKLNIEKYASEKYASAAKKWNHDPVWVHCVAVWVSRAIHCYSNQVKAGTLDYSQPKVWMSMF